MRHAFAVYQMPRVATERLHGTVRSILWPELCEFDTGRECDTRLLQYTVILVLHVMDRRHVIFVA